MTRHARLLMRLIQIVSLITGSWLCAGTVDALFAAGMPRATPGPAPTRVDHALPPHDSGDPLLVITSRNIFNHGEPVPDEDVVAVTAAAEPGLAAEPGACTLPIEVLLTVTVERNPALSLVTYLDSSVTPGLVAVAQVGDRIAGSATVMAVYDEVDPSTFREVGTVVVASEDGQRQTCRSGTDRPSAAAPAMPLAMSEGIQCSSSTRCTISHTVVDALTKDMMAVAGMVHVSPWSEGGVGKGFRLDYIQPNTPFASLGLLAGDQVARINGYEMSDPVKAIQVWQLVKNERSISIDLKRAGQNQTMNYSIQ